MNIIKINLAVLLTMFWALFSFTGSVSGTEKGLIPEANKRVDALVGLLSDNWTDESPKSRRFYTVDIDKTRKLVAVFFWIEGYSGGNSHKEYMAIFTNYDDGTRDDPNKLTLIDFITAGGRCWRDVDSEKVSFRWIQKEVEIKFKTTEVGPNDSCCCPTQASYAVYRITPNIGGRLREIKN